MTDSTDRPQFTEGQRVTLHGVIDTDAEPNHGEVRVLIDGADDVWPVWLTPEHFTTEPTVTHHGAEPVPQRVLCALDQCEPTAVHDLDVCGWSKRLMADAKAHDGRTLGQVARDGWYLAKYGSTAHLGPWSTETAHERECWEAAAQAVADALPSPFAPPPMGEAAESNNEPSSPPPHFGFYQALSDRLAAGDAHYAWPPKPDRAECYDRAVELYFKHHEDEDSDYPWDDDDHAFVLRIARFLAGDPS